MNIYFRFLLTGTLWLTYLELTAQEAPLVFQDGQVVVALQDDLDHPFYWWPSTLLSYPIEFEASTDLDQLMLVDDTDQQQLFQLTDIRQSEQGNQTAMLHLLSDLPSGGKQTYTLKLGNPEPSDPLQLTEAEGEYIIHSDKLSLKIPKDIGSGETLPGPIVSLRQTGQEWMGSSELIAGGKQLTNFNTEVVNQGPLFIEMSVRYQFDDGASYTAHVRCIRGYEFVELKEQMSGFPEADAAFWRMDWHNFSPTHRQAPNHPWSGPRNTNDEPGFGRYDWEAIDQTMLNNHHGVLNSTSPTGKIPFEIGIYDPWPAERTVSSALFWDERNRLSVGAFMDNVAYWDDQEYSIWHSSRKLAITFYYKDQLLRWKYPVSDGQRSSSISCYDHQKDIDFLDTVEKASQKVEHPKGFKYGIRMSQLSYNSFLQNRYSTIDLNEVKDWDLGYTADQPLAEVIFEEENIKSVDELERRFLFGGYVNELPFSGPCQNSGYSPVPARSFYDNYVVAYNRLLPQMSPEERNRFAAMFQFHAYMAAGEEYMPMKVMLSGHPNFLADVKGIPALAAFLFPGHSQANEWASLFEKYVDLNTRYHVRPDVDSWNATGGRWTENLGTYIWAFLRPTIRSNYLLRNHYDGKNRMANQNMVKIGSYVMGTLSAPYDGESIENYRRTDGTLDKHSWGVVTPEIGPARVHPPQGAHAMRRQPPSVYWRLGKVLENYDPLLSENIRYISRPEHDDMEALDREKSPFKIMFSEPEPNLGTPPDFRSAKYTGYGIILRAAVGTPEELSVHLTQIDQGHNYRWGKIADGGCGSIYFYAAGKSYSHNGKEDSGDRRLQDTDLITNFGAYKDGVFRSIGQNELSSPFYDLGVGQFAEITSSEDVPYSWPEFQSRSIMLVGSDYFIIYDDVYNGRIGTRFSWFTHLDEELPEIQVLTGGGTGHSGEGGSEKVTHIGSESKGVSYDGTDDFMTLVSHKKGYTSVHQDYGAIVTTPEGNQDFIFRSDDPVRVNETDAFFEGTAGFIRKKKSGVEEWSLFHGEKIGNARFSVSADHSDAGLSLRYEGPHQIVGEYSSPKPSTITFQWSDTLSGNLRLYVDGQEKASVNGKSLTYEFPEGHRGWQLTEGLPVPPRPQISRTRNQPEAVYVEAAPVAGASAYQFEYSTNLGKTWETIAQGPGNTLNVKPSGKEKKGHIRVIALNDDHQSEASVVYPVYYTTQKPPFPDGLKANACDRGMALSWGQVMGCDEYRLYRREAGTQQFEAIQTGSKTGFIDSEIQPEIIYEYAVSSLNGNGESEKSVLVTTDPDSWLQFEPVPDEAFRRTRNSLEVTESDMYYPE